MFRENLSPTGLKHFTLLSTFRRTSPPLRSPPRVRCAATERGEKVRGTVASDAVDFCERAKFVPMRRVFLRRAGAVRSVVDMAG